jgi:hypothetical protein
MTATRSPSEGASTAVEVTAEPVEAAMTEVAVEEGTEEPPAETTVEVEVIVEPTVAATAEAIVEATAETIVEATAEPTAEEEAMAEATAEPTEEATAEATAEPTEEVMVEATVEPTEEATAEAIAEPTEETTVEATAEPTAEATAEPTEAAPAESPTIIFPADEADVISGQLTLIGSGEPGTEVELLDNDTVLDVVTVDSDGEWSLTLEPAEGDHQYSARVPGQEVEPDTSRDVRVVSSSGDYDCDSNPGLVREDSYIVGTCDTLVDVSDQLGIAFEDLAAANPEIEEPDLIYPGQELTLP